MSIEALAINLVANQIEEHYENNSEVSEWESYPYIEDYNWDYELKAMEDDVVVDISNITFKELGDEWWNQWLTLLEWKLYEEVQEVWKVFKEYERNRMLKTNGVGGI